MIDSICRYLATMNSKYLLFNIFMVLCIFSLKRIEVEAAATAIATDGTIKKEFEDVELSCTVNGITTYKMEWKRDGEILESSNKYTMDADKRTLTIKMAGRGDVGEYECVFIPEPASSGTGQASAKPYVRSPPFVDTFYKSVSEVEGGEAVMQCKVFGYPVPTVEWYKSDTKSTDDVGVKVVANNKTTFGVFKKIVNAELTIKEVIFEDRAYYACQASDGKNSTTEKVLLRIKGRYAAVWPTIGIVIELVLLIIIIIIYEKRKSKGGQDDDSDSGGKSNSHDQRGDARQRKNVST